LRVFFLAKDLDQTSFLSNFSAFEMSYKMASAFFLNSQLFKKTRIRCELLQALHLKCDLLC